MLLRVDPASRVPLFEQLASEIRGAIATGAVASGERLPPARALGRDLGVNMHTVLRAYGRLRDEGLIELRRGRGAVVAAGGSAARAQLQSLAAALTAEAQRQGLSRTELHRLIEDLG